MSDTVLDTPEVENTENEQVSYLSMSDAEMLAAGPPSAASSVKEALSTPIEEKAPEVVVEAEDDDDKEDEDEDKDAVNEDIEDKAADQDVGTTATEAADKLAENHPASNEALKDKVEVAVVIDYEAEYKKVFAPFKANGHEVEIKSAADAISLMQMGANYNKKMSALKPNLKLMKLLEINGLMNEEKLSYLIDLDKKNPAAINKLVKDSGIDPMDLDAEKAGEYRPKIHAVDDREIDLDTVLDELQDTSTYARMLDVVSQKWDGASKQVISRTPQLLKVINGHMESGIYDLISKEVDSERVFGRLNGLSDLEAYRQVGDAIQARGGFNHVGSAAPKNPVIQAPVVVAARPKKVEDDLLKEKRRAASSTKPVAPTAQAKEFNPLSLSDEEFSKLADSRFR